VTTRAKTRHPARLSRTPGQPASSRTSAGPAALPRSAILEATCPNCQHPLADQPTGKELEALYVYGRTGLISACAEELRIREQTAKNHVRSLCRRLGANSPIQAIYRLWIGEGIPHPDDLDMAVLLAYARTGSIAGAARESDIGVPAIRRRLRALYAQLGVRRGIDAVFEVWVAHQRREYRPSARHRRSTHRQQRSVLDRRPVLRVTCPSCGGDEAEKLTERQLDCLWLYGRTGSIEASAQALGIGEGTVRTHLRSLNGTVGTRRSVQAVYRLWIGDGVPDPDDRDMAVLLTYARTGSLIEAARRHNLAVSSAKNLVHGLYARMGAAGVIDAVFNLWVAGQDGH